MSTINNEVKQEIMAHQFRFYRKIAEGAVRGVEIVLPVKALHKSTRDRLLCGFETTTLLLERDEYELP